MRSYLLVDGYNIINMWRLLKDESIEAYQSAREALIDIMQDYQGYTGINICIVFDAYRTKNKIRSFDQHKNITVVYTKKHESADVYIERTVNDIMDNPNGKIRIQVATSDHLQQTIASSKGALIISARELWDDVKRVRNEFTKKLSDAAPQSGRVYEHLPEDVLSKLADMRLENNENIE